MSVCGWQLFEFVVEKDPNAASHVGFGAGKTPLDVRPVCVPNFPCVSVVTTLDSLVFNIPSVGEHPDVQPVT